MTRVAVVGAAGYIGGELLRLLVGHPEVKTISAVSSRFPGKRVDSVHPNLRSATDLLFCSADEVDECDTVFLALPHRTAMTQIDYWVGRAKQVIDLTADFRLDDPEVYQRYYGNAHAAPQLLGDFVPGIPELHRGSLRSADLVSVPGCMAMAGVLALFPLVAQGLVEPMARFDARTGSSGSGATAGEANLHAERSGAMRVFAPTGHRHEAEISRHLGIPVTMTATGVEAVRGVQTICHVTLRPGVDIGGAQGVPRAVPERAIRSPGSPATGHLPLSGAEDPAGLELLRCRLRRRRGGRTAGDHRGAGQPHEGRCGRCGPVPEHPHGLAGNTGSVLPRPASHLIPANWEKP